MGERRRGTRGLGIESLPYRVKMYSNNQVLVPASLVRKLGFQDVLEAQVTIRYAGLEYTFVTKFLKTKYTDSRQFTVPKELREKMKIQPGAEIEVVDIKPLKRGQ